MDIPEEIKTSDIEEREEQKDEVNELKEETNSVLDHEHDHKSDVLHVPISNGDRNGDYNHVPSDSDPNTPNKTNEINQAQSDVMHANPVDSIQITRERERRSAKKVLSANAPNTPRSAQGSTSQVSPTLDGTILELSSSDIDEENEARDKPQPIAAMDPKKGRRLRTSSTMSCNGYEDSDTADTRSVSTSITMESEEPEEADHAFERKKRHLNVVQRPFAAWFIKQDWKSQRRTQSRAALESNVMQIIMMLLTFYALYSDDIRLATSETPEHDVAMGAVAFVVFIVFVVELIVLCYAVENYFLSFFFWLDLVAAISMIFDVEFIMRDTGLAGGGASEARAGRAAKVGAKAGRIVRLVRLIRLTNIMKWIRKRKDGDEDGDYQEFEDSTKYEPTKLGAFLSQMMTKKVILAVLTMILVLPYLQAVNIDDGISMMPSVERLEQWMDSGGDAGFIQHFIDRNDNDGADKDLVYLKVSGTVYLEREAVFEDLRMNEFEKFSTNSGETQAIWNTKKIAQGDAARSLGSTSFLIFMLGALAMAFTQDTEKYVVKPIRDMTNAIRNLASYEKAMKLMSKTSDRQSNRFSSLIKKKLSSKISIRRSAMEKIDGDALKGSGGGEHQDEAMETEMMQGTIRKLARLLELGFGIAGQEIVRKIITQSDGDDDGKGTVGRKRRSTEIDFTKTGGMMVNGIWGFAIIHKFNETLQALEGQTMIYVNAIAQIVHSIVHQYGGAANKNIGNAFLLVWKLPGEEEYNEYGIDVRKQNLADQALLAFLKIIIEIRSNADIQRYARHPEVRKIIGPNWHVSLGFGLHSGWGIEGAIGSRHKIDASYLSPNVNLAARLESGTKQFGVDLLLSDAFVQLLSTTARKFCRQIDVVCVKGSAVPIGLWTYDLIEREKVMKGRPNLEPPEHGSFGDLGAEESKDDTSQDESTAERLLKIKTPISHIIEAVQNERDNITTWERVFLEDSDLKRYRKNLKREFYVMFKDAFLHYVEGRWDVAKAELLKCKDIFPGDGPTGVLLGVLASHKDQAPPNWGGNRSLTSK